MENGEPKRAGRPWSFDRDRAVETAMRLFWRHGYEGVAVSDLTGAIGIAPPSLYAAFGSKAGLFREALVRYEDGGRRIDAEPVAATSLPGAVRAILERAVAAATDPAGERGCMVSSGLVACHPDHRVLAADVAARRRGNREGVARALRPFADAAECERVAGLVAVTMGGLSIAARDGEPRKTLLGIVDEVVAGIEARHAAAAGARPGP